jgi:hypothetical protein
MTLRYRGWTEDVAGYTVIQPQEDKLTAEFERDVRAALALEKKAQDDFRRDVRATFDVVRATLEADKGLDKGELLEVIREATIKVTIGGVE